MVGFTYECIDTSLLVSDLIVSRVELEEWCASWDETGHWESRESLAPWIIFSEILGTIGIVIPQGFENYVLVRHMGPGDNHGGLGNENLGGLIEILSKFTITPEECFPELWDGQGWMHRGAIATYKVVRHQKLHRFFRNPKINRFF